MKVLKWSTLLLASTLLSACVSKGTHKKTLEELQAANEANQKKEESINQLEEKLLNTTKDKGKLKASLDEMKQAMDEMRARQLEQKQRLAEFRLLTDRFKSLTDAGALSIEIKDGKMTVSLGSDVLFPSGSAQLSNDGKETIKQVAEKLATISDKRYQVEGHTDNVPIATAVFPSNWELASARALNVTKAMIESGLPASRVSAASYGDTQPVASNETKEGKASNRRIAIVVVPDLSSLPGYDELNQLSTKN
ncbi:OmpA family protein [bacterium]|nr:OmpA family protein [bacterium]